MGAEACTHPNLALLYPAGKTAAQVAAKKDGRLDRKTARVVVGSSSVCKSSELPVCPKEPVKLFGFLTVLYVERTG